MSASSREDGRLGTGRGCGNGVVAIGMVISPHLGEAPSMGGGEASAGLIDPRRNHSSGPSHLFVFAILRWTALRQCWNSAWLRRRAGEDCPLERTVG